MFSTGRPEFVCESNDRGFKVVDLRSRLFQQERDELETLMDVRDPSLDGPMQGSITRVHGLLTSIVSGPILMPSEWLPVIFNDPDEMGWESQEQAQRAMSLVMHRVPATPTGSGPWP
jgi:hypothetical protein